MDWQTWFLFVTTVFFLSATPGPNMLLALSHGIRFGARKAVATGIGTIAALMILMIVSVTGLGAILAASETAFSIVKWCGVAYLLFLGVRTWRAPGMTDVSDAEAAGAGPAKPTPAWKLGAQAFLVCFSNPKAIVFFVALFPQFLETSQPLGPQVGVLALTFGIVEFLWIMAYATGGGRLVPVLKRAGFGRLVNRLSGGMLIGAGALLAVARRI
jgi:threonine/homoserine/homoserine lactone efflux protein